MPNRVSEPQHLGGSERLLSEDPSPAWRRQFLRSGQESGIFSGVQFTVASGMVVFEIERSALALTCEKMDQWIAHANGEAPSSGAPSRTESPVPRTPTIVVVDDQPDIGPMARDILEPAGYVVLLTSDPLEAVRMARHRPGDMDLLLVDVVMPLMDGRELARRMLSLRPQMKVVLMSGYEVSGLADTGWPFIAKPFGMQELTQKIADTLRGDPLRLR